MVRQLAACACAVAALSTAPAAARAASEARIYVAVATDRNVAVQVARPATAFHVWENGAEREVLSAGPASDPPAVVVIIHGFDQTQTADTRKALTALVDGLRAGAPHTRIAIVGDVVTPKLVDITEAGEAIDSTARRFANSGSNLVYFEAIRDAAKALGKEPSERRIIFSLTNSTRYDSDQQMTPPTIDALKKSRASVWSVDVTPENAGQSTNLHATTEMENFVQNAATYSGGLNDHIFGTTALEGTVGRMVTLILAQQQITFARPADKGESQLRIGVAGVPNERVIGPAWYVR